MLIESVENVGGMEYSAIRLSGRLIGLGHAVSIVESCPIQGYLVQRRRLRDAVAGIPLWRLPAVKRWRPVFVASYGASSALALTLLRRRFDVLHVHQLTESFLPAILTARRLGKPVVAKLTSAGALGDLARLQQRTHPSIASALLRSVDRFLALTTELERELVAAGVSPERIVLVPNGVDTAAFRPAASTGERSALRDTLGLPAGPLFVFVGRLVEKKRVGLLLEAWAQVRRRVDAHLVVVGDGPLHAALARQAREAGIEQSVSFVGESDRVPDYLRAADGFVLPSVSEGLSNALLEAMSCGLACVVTDSAGARNVIQDGRNGRLLGDETPSGLAALLVGLAERHDEREALGLAARATVEASFGLDSVARRYAALYDSLLGRPGSLDTPTPEWSAPDAVDGQAIHRR